MSIQEASVQGMSQDNEPSSEETSIYNGRIKYSDQYLITTLQTLGEELGRTPTVNDVQLLAGLVPDLSTYERRFGSWKAALAAAGMMSRNGASNEAIIAELKTFIEELGRVPTKAEINANKSIVSVSTIRNRFGSLSVALTCAGGVLTGS